MPWDDIQGIRPKTPSVKHEMDTLGPALNNPAPGEEPSYRDIFNATSDALVVHDEQGRILLVNHRSCELFGFSHQEFPQLSVGDLSVNHPPYSQAEASRHVQQALSEGSCAFTWRSRRKNGEPFWSEVALRSCVIGGKTRIIASVRNIDDRAKAEQELGESRSLLRAIIDSTTDMIWSVDAQDFRMRTFNRALSDYFLEHRGIRLQVGQRPEDLFLREERDFVERWKDYYQRALVSGPFTAEYLAYGGKTTLLLSFSPLQRDEVVFGVSVFGQDITERRRAEAALRDSESNLRAVFERSRDAIGISLRGQHAFANPAYLTMFGFESNEQIAGTPVLNHIAPSHRPDVSHNIAQRAAGKSAPAFYETRGITTSGVEFDMEVRVSSYVSRGELYSLATIRDITERKRAEQAHARLATVVEQAAETIVITDTQGKIVYANPAFEKTTGYTSAEAIGQNPRLLKSGKQNDEHYRDMWRVLERGGTWHGHFVNRRKDGTLYEEEATISPVRDAAGRVVNYVAVKRDVTREMRLESQFRQAQKMEAIGQLAGGVAHDFNNILASTMMNLSLLQESEGLAPPIQETLRELMQEAERAANLTRQLLMFSRRSVMEMKVLDLNQLVTNLLKMLGRLIGEHIVVRFHRREGLPALQVDAERVQGQPQAEAGQFLCLSLADTGCGMDEATRQHIFEPFFTTKEAGKGTGLGLATVHGIVAQHRGWVEVESEVGRGTTLRVFLPTSTKQAGERVETGKTVTLGGNEAILLVEDEAGVRRSVAQGLRLLGYAVLEAENGQAAMKLWQRRSRKIDLLFSDMVMPGGLTGLDLAQKLREDSPELKVIISSGYNADMAAQAKPLADDVVYLQKPYHLDLLSMTVRSCLDRKA